MRIWLVLADSCVILLVLLNLLRYSHSATKRSFDKSFEGLRRQLLNLLEQIQISNNWSDAEMSERLVATSNQVHNFWLGRKSDLTIADIAALTIAVGYPSGQRLIIEIVYS